jgi:uncharacterized membrane protein
MRSAVLGGIFLGLGLGGFFDGIVLHQILQWHHVGSQAGFPSDTVQGLRDNTLLDGLFHAATYAFVVIGILLILSGARRWSVLTWRGLLGTVLLGFGIFNLAEGLVNHHLLGLHHVNETVPPGQWLLWDLGFLASGVLLVWIGGSILRAGPVVGRR